MLPLKSTTRQGTNYSAKYYYPKPFIIVDNMEKNKRREIMTAFSGDGYLSFFVLSHKNFNPQILNFVLPTRIIMLFNYCNQNEIATLMIFLTTVPNAGT